MLKGFKRGLRACFEKGEWWIKDELREIYKLTDFVNVIDGDRGNNYPKKEQMSKDGETLFLSASNITKNGFNKDDCNFISNEQSNKMSKGVVLPGDIVITSRGTVGNVAYFKDLYGFKNIRINSGMLILRVKDLELAPSIYQYLKSPQFTRNLELITSGSAQPQLTKSDVNKIKINSFNGGIKNAKNGILLSLIDDLITYNQMRLKENEHFLEAYYQKFIINEHDWKINKIGEIFKVTRGSVLSKEDMELDHGKYPVYSSQTLNNGLVGYYDKYLYENAITWTTDGYAGEVNYRRGKFYCTNVCGVLINEDYTNTFNAYHLNKKTKKYVTYVGNNKLMNNVMVDISVAFPPHEDSEKYSKLFDAINDRNKMINERIDILKQVKQYYLNVIFK